MLERETWQTKELLQKPLQKTWCKVQKPERGEELACGGKWEKKTAEKKTRGNAENTY